MPAGGATGSGYGRGGFESTLPDATRRAILDLTRRLEALQAQITAISPVTGSFLVGGFTTAPTGYLMMGQTVIDGATDYPGLASMYPSWVSGSDLVLPNVDGAVLMGGATPGVVSGSMTHTLLEVNLPAHNHSMTHDHAHTLAAPAHTHTTPAHSHDAELQHYSWTGRGTSSGATTMALAQETGAGPWTNSGIRQNGSSGGGTSGGASATALTGSVTDFIGPTGDAGSGDPVDHTPKNFTVKVAVKT